METVFVNKTFSISMENALNVFKVSIGFQNNQNVYNFVDKILSKTISQVNVNAFLHMASQNQILVNIVHLINLSSTIIVYLVH